MTITRPAADIAYVVAGGQGSDAIYLDHLVVNSGGSDYYGISVKAGDPLAISTATPADGPNQFVNTLDPKLELYSPSGTLVASDDNGGADGRNALLHYTAAASGQYVVRVVGAGGTTGEYLLNVAGATGAAPAFNVASITPANGSLLSAFPLTMTVDFSGSVLLSSLAASDLTVDGVPATGFSVVDYNTVAFNLPAMQGDDTYTVSLPAGAVSDIQGTPLQAYTEQFTVDSTPPRVISSSIQEGDALTTIGATYIVQFSKSMLTANLDASDITLQGTNIHTSYTPTSLSYNRDGTTLIVYYASLPVDRYTLTLLSAAGRFQDAAGLDLDGEATAWPIPPNQSGDGVAGGNFVLHFNRDTAPVATVALNTTAPRTNNVLTATATKSDADGDSVSLTFVWKVNGVIQQTHVAASGLTDTFNLSQFGGGNPGDVVTVEVTPNDGLTAGATVTGTATVVGSTRTWTGGGANDDWSTAANWAGNVVPVTGDQLVFAGATQTASFNDFADGTSFQSITFDNGDFTVSGHAVVLNPQGGVAIDSLLGHNTIALPLTLAPAATGTTIVQAGILQLEDIAPGPGSQQQWGSGSPQRHVTLGLQRRHRSGARSSVAADHELPQLHHVSFRLRSAQGLHRDGLDRPGLGGFTHDQRPRVYEPGSDHACAVRRCQPGRRCELFRLEQGADELQQYRHELEPRRLQLRRRGEPQRSEQGLDELWREWASHPDSCGLGKRRYSSDPRTDRRRFRCHCRAGSFRPARCRRGQCQRDGAEPDRPGRQRRYGGSGIEFCRAAACLGCLWGMAKWFPHCCRQVNEPRDGCCRKCQSADRGGGGREHVIVLRARRELDGRRADEPGADEDRFCGSGQSPRCRAGRRGCGASQRSVLALGRGPYPWQAQFGRRSGILDGRRRRRIGCARLRCVNAAGPRPGPGQF